MIADRDLSYYLARVRHTINTLPDMSRWEQLSATMDTALDHIQTWADIPSWIQEIAPVQRLQIAHEHRFIEARCMVCGCGEPENSHADPSLPIMPRDEALRLALVHCPGCGRTVSEPDGAWYVGMVCPECGHVFTLADERAQMAADVARQLKADLLSGLEY